jgi:hypothetical protein
MHLNTKWCRLLIVSLIMACGGIYDDLVDRAARRIRNGIQRVYFRILEKVRESGHAEKEEGPDESKPRGKESAIDGAA